MTNSMTEKCPYCGKERPWNYYGGIGPCDCQAYQEAERAARLEAKQKEAARAIEEHHRLHVQAVSCEHEFVGGFSPADGYCRKCGISLGNYYKHR